LRADNTWVTPPLASTTNDGTVTALPTTDQTIKYLRGDNTWVTPAAFTGATASIDGKAGFVPIPVAGRHNRFLRGDGTWAVAVTPFTGATTTTDGTEGGVPAPPQGNPNRTLRANGTWSTGTTVTTPTANLALTAEHTGGLVNLTSAVIVTLNNSIFAAGQSVEIYNSTTTDRTISFGTSISHRLQPATDPTTTGFQAAITGNSRTLKANGYMRILFITATSAIIMGYGIATA
jgi:hypothetical protein